MSLFLGFMFLVLFVAAAFQYVSITSLVEPVLPLQFKDTPQASHAMHTYVWSSQEPEIARKRYVRSFGLMALAIAALALRELLDNGFTARFVVASVFTTAFCYFFSVRWLKYRAFHRAD